MTDEELLADLSLTWEERYEQGQDLSVEELCTERPDLKAALASRIRALKKTAWVKTVSQRGRAEVRNPTGAGTTFSESSLLAGRYRLEKKISEGGYGEVWQGFDVELQRPVAVKVPKKRRRSGGTEELFLSEARKVARLKHPGIVPVYDVGRHEDAYFIVSDLIDGRDLDALLQEKPMMVREAVRVVADAARHLQYAHDQGFVHRDIKPSNILLDRQGKVYLTDFGIALTNEELVLRGGDGLGTLAYMSPEQLHGDPTRIDSRTDIYSLGVVLYELLTAHLPFEAETPEGMRESILRDEPPLPHSLKKTASKKVTQICLKCLAKSPANRYSTAQSLADDLTAWLSSRRTNWRLVGMALSCAVIVAWLGIVRPWMAPDERAANLRLAIRTPAELLGEERALFNGRDLEGWEYTNQKFGETELNGETRLEEAVFIKDGVLHCREKPKYWLFTRDAYADFVLKIEYRFPHKPKWSTGSVVLLRMTQPGPDHDAHFRVRIGGWAAAKIQQPDEGINQSNSNDQSPRLAGVAEAQRATGEWNELTVTCVGGAIAVRLNGKLVNQAHHPMAKEGTIGLAPQGNAVEFRSVRLTPIKK